jgi:predicted dehydrogenase
VSALRLLVVGAAAGVWGFHGPAIAALGAEVVGVFDPNEEGARRRAEELGCVAASTLEALLALEADAAVVLAPHPSHAALAGACLRVGLHVLVEKPLTVSLDEAPVRRCRRPAL